LLAAGLSLAQRPAGPNRPALLPADYPVTPFGYFHPSCVQHLAKGDEVRRDEKAIRHANGTLDNIQARAFPHFKADGTKIVGDERGLKDPTIGHAWVEYAGTTTTTCYAYLYAYWNVPSAPSSHDMARPFICFREWRTTPML
jgi:hypothetical protein